MSSSHLETSNLVIEPDAGWGGISQWLRSRPILHLFYEHGFLFLSGVGCSRIGIYDSWAICSLPAKCMAAETAKAYVPSEYWWLSNEAFSRADDDIDGLCDCKTISRKSTNFKIKYFLAKRRLLKFARTYQCPQAPNGKHDITVPTLRASLHILSLKGGKRIYARPTWIMQTQHFTVIGEEIFDDGTCAPILIIESKAFLSLRAVRELQVYPRAVSPMVRLH
jgi:hypothetical protein